MQKNEYVIAYFHPNVMRYMIQDGTEEYAVHDVFFNTAGKSITWTTEALAPRMPSVQALKEKLILLLQSKEPPSHELDGQYTHANIQEWLKYIDAEPILWELGDDEQDAQIARDSRRVYAEPRVLLHHSSDGAEEFAIHEVYFNEFGEVIDWTDDALSPRLPTIPALREELLMLLEQAKPPKSKVISGDAKRSYRLNEVRTWLDATEKAVLS